MRLLNVGLGGNKEHLPSSPLTLSPLPTCADNMLGVSVEEREQLGIMLASGQASYPAQKKTIGFM